MSEDEESDSAVFTKTKATVCQMGNGSKEVVWEGAIMESGRVGFATLVRGVNGDIAGSFSTEAATYSLITMPDGSVQVRAQLWKDADLDDLEDEGNDEDLAKREPAAPSSSKSESKLSPMMFVHFDNSGITKTFWGNSTLIEGPKHMLRTGGNRNLQGNHRIDVLVIVTNRAMCEYAGLPYGCALTASNTAPIEQRLRVVQSETNQAMQGVGVNAEIRIIGLVHLTADFDGGADGYSLDVIDKSSNVRDWRNAAGADLVHMITGGSGGIATVNSYRAVTGYQSLNSYVFIHEVSCLKTHTDSFIDLLFDFQLILLSSLPPDWP